MIYQFLTSMTEGIPPPPPMIDAWQLSLDQIFQRVYDVGTSSIRVTFTASPSGSTGSKKDFVQLIKSSFDPVASALRVTNEATAAPAIDVASISKQDYEQAAKDVFDETRAAFRVSSLGSNVSVGSLDAKQILRLIHVFETHSWRVTNVGASGAPAITAYGFDRAVMLAFNKATGRLRVST